nr:MAG TPA: hypothetical protein [Caudoviricetes sp.]
MKTVEHFKKRSQYRAKPKELILLEGVTTIENT